MGPDGVDAVAELAGQVERVIACPDADLGGVRIAEQVLAAFPTAMVIDIGRFPHAKRAAFKPGGVSEIGLRAALDGAAGSLARACLERGYPVEQELAAIDALAGALNETPRISCLKTRELT